MSAELIGDDRGRDRGPYRPSGVPRRPAWTERRYSCVLVLVLGLLAAGCADDGGESARPPQAATSAPRPAGVERACATRQSEPASEAVRGEIVVMSRADPRVPGSVEEDHLHFVLTPCGDLRLETATVVNAHDAVEGTTRSLVTFDQIASRATVTRRGMSKAAPKQGSARQVPPQVLYGAARSETRCGPRWSRPASCSVPGTRVAAS